MRKHNIEVVNPKTTGIKVRKVKFCDKKSDLRPPAVQAIDKPTKNSEYILASAILFFSLWQKFFDVLVSNMKRLAFTFNYQFGYFSDHSVNVSLQSTYTTVIT